MWSNTPFYAILNTNKGEDMVPSHLEFHNGEFWTGVERVKELKEGELVRFVDTGGRVVKDEEGYEEFKVAADYGRERDSGILGLAIEPVF